LTKQLQRQHERYESGLIDKHEEVNRMRRKRETVGVELYSMQQQLARQQLTMEKIHDQFVSLKRGRAEAEEELKAGKQVWDTKKGEQDTIDGRVTKAQKEYDALMATYDCASFIQGVIFPLCITSLVFIPPD
jgi:chromosome segregation ATPase